MRRRSFVRDVGRGRPLIVLHGGPDFDHAYLRPELDAFADAYRLIYYSGLSEREAAEALGIAVSTLKRDWSFAKACLLDQLSC